MITVRARLPAAVEEWGPRLADRVVAEVADFVGGPLRPETSKLLADLTLDSYTAFLAVLAGDDEACGSQRLAELYGRLFNEVGVSFEDAMTLHRHLEQVLMREVRDAAALELGAEDLAQLEAVGHRFFNDLAATLTDRYLASRRAREGDRDAVETELLECLLSSTPPPLGHGRRAARLLGVELDVAWQVMVVAPADSQKPISSAFPAQMRQMLWGAVVLVGLLEPGLVVAVHHRGGAAHLRDLGQAVVCGIGGTHADVRGMRQSHLEALEVLDLASRRGLAQLRLEDAWFDRFLLGAVSAEELAALVLAPVAGLTSNRRIAVLDTLEAYLDCGGIVTEVADALHMHRQSVNYRMHNVRKLFGQMLLTADGRLALHIAVKAARLQAPRSPFPH